MRLQLIVAVALAAAATPAAAEPPPELASATMRVYADDDRLTVVSPATHLQVTGGSLTVDVDLAIDAVSAASVDVITAASPTPFTENRIEGGLGVTYGLTSTTSLRAGGQISHENDYDAVRVALGVIRELARRNTTLELRGRLGRDHATAVGDPTFSGDRSSAALTAVVTQVVDRRTILDVTAEGSWADGWHGSPYRRVLIDNPVMPDDLMELRERTPERRVALAVALRGRRALGERWFASLGARGYVDDWSVHSATATVELRRRLSDRTLLGVAARGYLQDGAEFWLKRQPDATTEPTYRTADRTLGPMATAELELIGDRVLDDRERRLTVAVGGLSRWFLDHLVQTRRMAITATVSFTAPL